MDAVERLALAARQELAHGLVREDHQLLDEPVRRRLGLDPGPLDVAFPVEGERRLAGLDPQRAAAVAAPAQLRRQPFGEASVSAASPAASLPARISSAPP